MSREKRKPCIFDEANLFSKLTFWWLNPVFGKSPWLIAEDSGRCDVSVSDEADLLERRLDGWWKKEVRHYSEGGRANLTKAVLATFLLQWLLPGLILLLAEAARLCQPVLLGLVLGYICGEGTASQTDAYLMGFGLGCMLFLHAILSAVFFFLTQRVALKMKAALEALLYRKVVSLSSEAALVVSPATVLDQVAASTEVFSGTLEHTHYLWVGPIQVSVVVYLLHYHVGVAGVLCLVMVLAVIVVHAVLEVAAIKLREKSQVWTDQRWAMMTRILDVVVQIKICCLESKLGSVISSLRSKEMVSVRGLAAVQGLLWCMLGASCRLLLLLTVMVGVEMQGTLSTGSVLTTLALLDVLTWTLQRFPVAGIRDWQALQRTMATAQLFLLLDEEKEQIKDLRLHRTVSYRNEPYADWVVDIDHMTARWPAVHTGERKRFQKRRLRDSTSSTKSLLHESDVEHAFSLKYLSLQVKKGELLAVIGCQNSGKSSLLMTLINELPYEIGQICVNGRVAFCAQQPWLFSGSLRDNILFDNPYDATRYDTIIKACSLNKLLELLPDGDETMVGERGLQLSSGYKAKVTLARAVYHNADIYLFDDIFMCLDNHTRLDTMKRCVSGLLEAKTRIIVTRNIHVLKAASRIAVLREGSLYDVGSYEELQSRGVDVREFISSDLPQHQNHGQLEAEEENFRVRLALWKADKKRVRRDDLMSQSDLHVLVSFLCGRTFWCLLPVLLLLWLGAQCLSLAADWTLATNVYGFSNIPNMPTVPPLVETTLTYLPPSNLAGSPSVNLSNKSSPLSIAPVYDQLQLYGILVAVATVIGFAFAMAIVQTFISAASSCHDSMLHVMMRAKTSFFLVFPIDGVLSTFSRHLCAIDTCLPYLSYLNLETVLRVFGLMVLICVVNPWLVIAVIPLVLVMATLQVFGARTMRGVRMLRESAQEPVMWDVRETLRGLQTIRSFKRQDFFLQTFDGHLNLLTWSRFLALCVHSRLLIVCVFIVALFLSIVIYVSIMLVGSVNSGLLALSVTYCVTILIPMQWLLRQAVGLGNAMVSVRRALLLAGEDQEAGWSSDKPPPPDWPNRGSVTFSSTSLLAGPEGPYLLRDINVHIKSKEKVGVVGEAGSGKYSLVAALLRLGQVHGMLFMDGFNILKIGLHELRKSISVVAKDPILFPGTLRFNLDLCGTMTDEQLWGILDQVGLRDRVAGIRGGLSVEVTGDETLFSLGQKQLLGLARALVSKTRLLVFEEATESLEHGLNDQIQRILRAKFRDCTVLTIAHRLSSVMDCDRIMVFSGGEVREFDTPYSLMQTEDGWFRQLVDQTGRRQAQHLRTLAELSHQQRASASLMLEHAAFMATEQLHASTEDLTFRPGSLAWSNLARFSKSQDSLEKAHSDWGSRGDLHEEEALGPSVVRPKPLPSMAPAQKLINKRRMSPNRRRAPHEEGVGEREEKGGVGEEGGEQHPLLSHHGPPPPSSRPAEAEERGKQYRPNARSKAGAARGESEASSPLVEYSSSPRHRVRSPTDPRPQSSAPAGPSAAPGGPAGRRILETPIDTPPAPRRNFSPFPSDAEADDAKPQRVKGRLETSRGRTSSQGGNQPARARIISGEYSSSKKERQEDPERIIYC